MARPTGWDILGTDGDPTPGVVETVQALAKQFGDFAHDVEAAYANLNRFGSDATAMEWVGQTAEAFKGQFGPLPGRLQKLYISYSEASDALAAYAPKLQAAQSKADSALRQAQDANVDLQRATSSATNAAADLKTAQQNHAANPNPQTLSNAQTAHDTAQSNLKNAQTRMDALKAQAHQAHDDLDTAAKDCAKALHHAQHDGIHNKHWWQHVGEALSEWGGKIAEIANDIAPVLDVLAMATVWIPGVDLVTGALAEADNTVAMFATELKETGDALQGHFGDALMDAGMVGVGLFGGKALGKLGGKVLSKLGREAEGGAEGAEDAIKTEAREANGVGNSFTGGDPVDLISGEMLTAEVDIDLPGVLPVLLRRAYASGYDAGRLFGPGWSSTLDQRLSINEAGIHFAGDDGQVLHYALPVDNGPVTPVRGARWTLVWDRETDEVRITDPWTGLIRHFPITHYRDDSGEIRDLMAITDRNTNRISILRDESGAPVGLAHPGYRIEIDTVATTAGPRIAEFGLLDTDDRRITVKQYRYDDRGRLTEVVDSSGLAYRYEWDEADRITAWVDRVGYRYAYEYGLDGRVVRGTGDGGYLSAAFEYRDDEHSTVLTDSLGHRTVYEYDERGHLAAETDPLGHATRYEYDIYGRLLFQVDADGARTELIRNSHGQPVRIIEADGSVIALEYDDSFHAVAACTPNGTTWRREYDSRGNMITMSDPNGGVTSFKYTENGAPLAVIDPLGAVTRLTTDAAGLPIASVDPLGVMTRVTRDAFGRVTSIIDPTGGVTESEWTLEGLPASQVDQLGARTEWFYDAEGNLVRAVDPVGAATLFERGPFKTIKARISPDGTRHEFSYDTELNLVEVVNTAGATWRYSYDHAGRLIYESDFIGRSLAYEYDAVGRLAVRTTGSGHRISLKRDAMGRVIQRRTPDGDYLYSYDAAGRLAHAMGPGAELAYVRDAAGRAIAETFNGATTHYEYDALGRRTRRTTASGSESKWTYDGAGQPSMFDTGVAQLRYIFNTLGQEVERTFGPTVRLNREHDAVGRLTSLHLRGSQNSQSSNDARATTGLSRTWTWRADGLPTEICDSHRGTRRFTTDLSGRVTAVSGASWNENYAYDEFGNLAGSMPDGSATGEGQTSSSATVETDRTLIRRVGRTHYEYDNVGRMIRATRRTLDGRKKSWEYIWDSQDRLVKASTPDHGTWQYTYDPLGRRTSKTCVSDEGYGAAHTTFTWDGLQLAEQCTTHADQSVTVVTWDYDPGTFRPMVQRNRILRADADPVAGETAFLIVTDLVGTPTELVTTDGNIAWRSDTTLWGKSTSTEVSGGADCPIRFPGQYYDAETGLHYNLHRYYNPDTAAYLTPDPLGLTPAPNDHAYASNPLTLTDPLGLMCPLAAGSTPAAPSDPYADLVSDLRDAGHKIDPVDSRKEWEKAGRGLQKHHDRPENRNLPPNQKKWQCPDGKQNPASWNPLGRKTQDEILNNIDTIEHAYSRKYKTDILEVRATDGRGIRYKIAGGKFEFMGFCD